jgi:hypothetical protein
MWSLYSKMQAGIPGKKSPRHDHSSRIYNPRKNWIKGEFLSGYNYTIFFQYSSML